MTPNPELPTETEAQSPRTKYHDVMIELAKPLRPDEIEWRVGQSGLKQSGEPWAKVLAYMTNRAVQDRLDLVVGIDGWRNEFRTKKLLKQSHEGPPIEITAIFCGISIDFEGSGWITKWDASELTDVESVKGGCSAAMKRAAVNWGIGRYLYNLEEGWADFVAHGQYSARIGKGQDAKYHRWNPPPLPPWALPDGPAATESTQRPPAAPEGASEQESNPFDPDWPEASPAPAKPLFKTQANTQTPALAGNWREVVVPFGTNKDKKLGELMVNQLRWYAETWEPKPYNGSVSQKDKLLKAAAVSGFAELSVAQAAPATKSAEGQGQRADLLSNVLDALDQVELSEKFVIEKLREQGHLKDNEQHLSEVDDYWLMKVVNNIQWFKKQHDLEDAIPM